MNSSMYIVNCVHELRSLLESELVSGFMTEHAAVIIVFFFLAEYASIVLMCLLISILFLGGYNFNFSIISSLAVLCNNIYEFI